MYVILFSFLPRFSLVDSQNKIMAAILQYKWSRSIRQVNTSLSNQRWFCIMSRAHQRHQPRINWHYLAVSDIWQRFRNIEWFENERRIAWYFATRRRGSSVQCTGRIQSQGLLLALLTVHAVVSIPTVSVTGSASPGKQLTLNSASGCLGGVSSN